MFEELRDRSVVYAATAPEDPLSNLAEAAAHAGPSPRKTIITRSLLGSDAGLFGAARIPAMDR
jgi:hypothetical protein